MVLCCFEEGDKINIYAEVYRAQPLLCSFLQGVDKRTKDDKANRRYRWLMHPTANIKGFLMVDLLP
jgi:hypothetical protein